MNPHVLLVGGEDHHLRMAFFVALRNLGFRVSIAATGGRSAFEAAGFHFHAFKLNRFIDVGADLRSLSELRQVIRNARADVAHSFDTKISLLLPLAASASPQTAIVRTINGRGWTFSSRTPAAMALRLAYIALQRAASTATDATVFEHGGDQSFFKRMRLIGKSRSVLIPGAGIDVGGFEATHRSGPSRDALRKDLGLEGAEIVTTVTRVTREKGVIPLLQAADIVSRVRPSMRLLVVGPRDSEGPFAVPQHEFDKRRPYVLATGTRTDVPSLLGMSDVFAFPSEYAEGVPRAVMEAALCGLPIVATDIAGCREVITEGWNGLLTPKRNPARLAERIMELLENREAAQRMGARGPELIRSRFSLDAVVRGHADLYRVVLAGGMEKGRRASPRDDRPAQRAGAASLS